MSAVDHERVTATPPPGSVVFIIGMRINKLWKLHRWIPVFMAMPRMLRELESRPELGLRGYRVMLSGRSPIVLQYWSSVEQLNAYARDAESVHLPAWRRFNRRVARTGDVGIFHETIVIGDDNVESIYNNMPAALMGEAFGTVPVGRVGQSAARRMNAEVPDEPAVPEPARHP